MQDSLVKLGVVGTRTQTRRSGLLHGDAGKPLQEVLRALKPRLRAQFMVSVVAGCLVGLVLASGCATSGHEQSAEPAQGQESTSAQGPASAQDSVVVPTKEILGEDASAERSEKAEQDLVAAKQKPPVYRIGPGDVLNFRSFDDAALNMQVPVRYDGYISLQVIPDLKVEGLTREEAEDLVRKAYSEFYLDPQLTLSIAQVNSKTYTVMGEVSQPAQYPYTRPLTLMDAINTAGGMRVNRSGGDSYVGSTGQLVKAFIIRNVEDERKVLEFDLRGFRKPGPSEADTPVYPDDIVYVPESANLVYLLGEVRQPRVYAISEGLTLIRLLSLAGGYNESVARMREVAITREINDTETKIITFDVREALHNGTDFLLEPGDIVYVPRKRLVNAEAFLQRLLAPATTSMSFAQQIMNLYQQAYATYYTKEQFDRIYNSRTGGSLSAPLSYLQSSVQQNFLTLQNILSNTATQLVPPGGK